MYTSDGGRGGEQSAGPDDWRHQHNQKAIDRSFSPVKVADHIIRALTLGVHQAGLRRAKISNCGNVAARLLYRLYGPAQCRNFTTVTLNDFRSSRASELKAIRHDAKTSVPCEHHSHLILKLSLCLTKHHAMYTYWGQWRYTSTHS
jgi:hypothetical protein